MASTNIDYAHLDKASKSSERYLANRSEELESAITDIRTMREAKEKENESLRKDIADLEMVVEKKRAAVNQEEARLNQLDDPTR